MPACLKASAQGKPVSERSGSVRVGKLAPWDMRPYGINNVFNIAKMICFPEHTEDFLSPCGTSSIEKTPDQLAALSSP